MSVAKIVEISASSTRSFEDAVSQGLARASKTIDGIEGAWVKEQSVKVEGGRISEYRVLLKLTFLLRE